MTIQNCTAPWSLSHVNVNGDVYPCCNGARAVGNLNQRSFEEIWNGETMQSIRAHISEGKVHPVCDCRTCPYQHENPGVPVPAEIVAQDALTFYPQSNKELAAFEKAMEATRVRNQPWEVIFAPTIFCNLKCVMCPQGMGHVPVPQHLEAGILDSLWGALLQSNRIVLAGVGEPLLSPSFWKFIDNFPKLPDQYIRTNTNGLLLTPASSRRLVASALSEISISCDAATPETYRRIRGGDFTRLLSGIRNLLGARREQPDSKLLVYANMTLMRENLSDLESFVVLCGDLGVDAVVCSQLFSFGDTPDWLVRRPEWDFKYSDQMVPRNAGLARDCISRANETARRIGMPLHLECGTAQYAQDQLVAG